MAVESNYNWASARTSPSIILHSRNRARLGWWVLLAVLLSILVHIFLIIIFDIIKVDAWRPALPQDANLLRFKTSRVTISQAALDDIIPAPENEKEVAPVENAMPLVDTTLDEFELQEFLSEMEVRLTPEVTEATRVLTGEEPVPPRGELAPQVAETPPAATPEPVRVDMSTLKSQLLEATRASEQQPLLELNVAPESQDRDDLLERSGAMDGASDNSDVTKGFSNLNQLLSKTGPLSDNTKPILMPTDLLFEYDEYELKENAKLSLMRLGILIQRNPDSEFVIEGHTDTIGGVEYNQVLSERRAFAVRDWLINSLRIGADNVRAVGHGKSRPLINPEGDIDEQSLNRRVEIVINKNKPKI